jgi:hypothetical protein
MPELSCMGHTSVRLLRLLGAILVGFHRRLTLNPPQLPEQFLSFSEHSRFVERLPDCSLLHLSLLRLEDDLETKSRPLCSQTTQSVR